MTNVVNGLIDPIDQELGGGERVLWRGRPDPHRHFNGGDLILIPFSLFWGGFVIFWEASVLSEGAGLFFALWGIPFMVAGIYFIAGRFFVKAWRKKRTWYALTDRRVIVVERLRAEVIRELPIRDVGATEYRPRKRTGDLIFGAAPGILTAMYANSGMELLGRGGWPGSPAPPVAFYDVPDIADARAALDRARATSL